MFGKVVVENGVKKIVPLTADCGSGNPVGTVIAVYSNKVPNGYLPCNGVQFDTAQFPVLYALLGDDHTPDLRECTLKGIGESGRTVGAHVKAGGLAVGEFIDDKVQDFDFRTAESGSESWEDGYAVRGHANGVSYRTLTLQAMSSSIRSGATTEVKAVGVNWCIKATSGINENQADNVLSALSPVDVVALNNVHSVTSDAVAQALLLKANKSTGVYYMTLTPRQLNTAETITEIVSNLYNQGYRFIVFGVGWEEYETQPHAGSQGYFLLAETSGMCAGFLREYNNYNYTYACHWTDHITVNRFTGWGQI